ncbi:MAG: HEAT repeat domain-containing protein, partial [Proteobacteria bacterium]|nr:HEAT repeat domain-containing protein [Pseudomonadota bacterium]
NSKYIDAAQYWTAYSYAQTDQKKATDLYRQFLEQYQESKYYEDAVADFEKLTLGYSRAAGLTPVPPPPPRVSEAAPVVAPWPANVGRAQPVHTGLVPFPTKKEIDPAVQLKMDAIWALGANADDPEAYETVKAIALDTKQPTELRETALQTIGRVEGHDPVAVYVQVAASGDVRLRQSAIYGIGNVANRGDERALTALRSLASDPKQQREIREASLSSLSRLDEEGMLETLSTLARTDPDEALRVQAVYMIGREGRGKEQQALAILKSIASDESQKQKVRESAVQSLSLIESGEALALLTGIATGSQDKNLRLNAVFALSRAQNGVSEDVEQTLRGIAGNRREDSELRLTALYALRASKGDGSKDFLTSLALKDDDEKVRRTALHLLIQSSENKADLLSTLIR